jgi:hypothetical protein
MKRLSLAVCLVFLLACNRGETTPVGPVGADVDVRADLKPDVRAKAPKDDAATQRELALTVQGADLKLIWRTFDDGPNKYILSYRWEVVKSAEGVQFESIGKLNPVNAGSEAAAIEQQIVRLRWRTERGLGSQMGELSYKIAADGTGGPT